MSVTRTLWGGEIQGGKFNPEIVQSSRLPQRQGVHQPLRNPETVTEHDSNQITIIVLLVILKAKYKVGDISSEPNGPPGAPGMTQNCIAIHGQENVFRPEPLNIRIEEATWINQKFPDMFLLNHREITQVLIFTKTGTSLSVFFDLGIERFRQTSWL